MIERVRLKQRPSITIDTALTDPNLLGSAFGNPHSWETWLAVLKAAFGLRLTPDQQQLFASVAGNRAPPTKRVRELWAIIGRRGGKSRMAAALAVYVVCFNKQKLAHGERGMVLVLAASVEQARVVFSYALAFLQTSPVLRQEVVDYTRSEIRLRSGITIAIHANSFSLTASQISWLRRCCDRSIAAWTSRQASDERADQPSTHGCDGVWDVTLGPQRRILCVMSGTASSELVVERGLQGGIVSRSEIRNP